MKLVEAFRILQTTPQDARPLDLHLVCGFTPLHLQTFLAAHVQAMAPSRRVKIESGLFGDCIGNLERLAGLQPAPDVAVVALEWSDFDARLSLRSGHGSTAYDLGDVLRTARAATARFAKAIAEAANRLPLRVALPMLDLPPISSMPTVRASPFELELRAMTLELGAVAARQPNVAVLNPQRIDRDSPLAERRDVAAELNSGFPYGLTHASHFARALAELVVPPTAKKGVITDLDDTLWRGLLGEVGPAGVSFDLDHKSQAHALYQGLLLSLADAGVLLAVASKNDPDRVEQVFAERDELSPLKRVLFPIEASWQDKSAAVGRILRTWNVAADSVVFVDDSALELAEVKAAWPDVTCLRFPKESDAEAMALLSQLRDLCGKSGTSSDDKLRLESLRAGQAFQESAQESATPEAFLSSIDAELTFKFNKAGARELELINKTNQFNLNGRRYTDGEWLAFLAAADSFLLSVSYKDKFGPLGTVAVLAGRDTSGGVLLERWVLSCRAFSRRIEHATLMAVFKHFELEQVQLEFEATPKNGPVREFLSALLGTEPVGRLTLHRATFDARCPPLYHRLQEPTE